ncbi:hypothetical protein [Brevirhabdus sp.]|uniref:hypothetical protein n=1 Tax=Brevirhabdus sp. TaxID=2004514 RepID=UPI004059D202
MAGRGYIKALRGFAREGGVALALAVGAAVGGLVLGAGAAPARAEWSTAEPVAAPGSIPDASRDVSRDTSVGAASMLTQLGVLQKSVWSPVPPALFLAPQDPVPFLSERRALGQRLLDAPAGTPEQTRALIDLAAFYLSHVMVPEGLSVLGALDTDQLPPAQKMRALAFELALGVLDSRDRAPTARSAVLLEPRYAGWPDQPLFLAISYIRDGAPAQAGPLLPDAVARLARYPKPVQERVLPGLLEAAIETRQWRLARDLAAAFDGYAALKGGAAYNFLLGRVADTGGDPLAAFDSYARAMGGTDRWAHRARRALVDLGLREKVLDRDAAIELLTLETQLWRGDAAAAQVLSDLASLQAINGDTAAALATYGKMIADSPRSTLTAGARQKANTLIADFYARGAAGEFSLGRFMKAHESLSRYYRYNPVFAEASERFADTFLAAGATTVAAGEYLLVHDYLTVAADLGLAQVDPTWLRRLEVKRLEALLAGGRYDDLARLLAELAPLDDADLRRRVDVVAARYYSETGQHAALMSATERAPSPQLMRIRAQAFFEQGDWAAAERAYGALGTALGDKMRFADAVNFLLAAYRNGNMERTAALAADYPALTDLPTWSTIARGLSEEAPELLPLRKATARATVEQAAQTLDRLQGQ